MSPRNEEQNRQIRDERRKQILQAALEVFAKKGLSAAKISDIAAAAKLSHGLVYHYFSSKDEVFTALIEQAYAISIESVEYAFQTPGTPLDKLQKLTEILLSNFYNNKIAAYYFIIILQASTYEDVPQSVKDLMEKHAPVVMQLTVPIVIDGQKLGQIKDDDPVVLSASYWSLIQGLVLSYAESGDIYPFPTIDIVMRLLKA